MGVGQDVVACWILYKHFALKHPQREFDEQNPTYENKYSCSGCSLTFPRKRTLNIHVKYCKNYENHIGTQEMMNDDGIEQVDHTIYHREDTLPNNRRELGKMNLGNKFSLTLY